MLERHITPEEIMKHFGQKSVYQDVNEIFGQDEPLADEVRLRGR